VHKAIGRNEFFVDINKGNTANYDGSTKIADIVGNVRMVDPSTTLTTNALTYDLNNKIASYSTGGKIIGRKNAIINKDEAYNP
jgi:lipopolysaccharide export system protein LptA